MKFSSKIIGTGSAFPEYCLKNSGLVQKLAKKGIETNEEWILERTGIQQRRVAQAGRKEDFGTVLALNAAHKALQAANKSVEEIDQIIFATFTPDHILPSNACFLQKRLGAKNASAMDLNAACSGFVYALSVADQFIQTGHSRLVLVVGADILTSKTNWEDRGSCILFGDAAGAALLEAVEPKSESRVLSTHLGADGTQWELFYIEAGGSNHRISEEDVRENRHLMRMQGREMFKIATRTLTDFALKALDANQLKTEDLDWFIPHQANLRIIEAVAKRLGCSMQKVLINIDRYGNTSAATVPTALDEAVRNKKIKSGDLVLLDVFGAGLTSGSALIRW